MHIISKPTNDEYPEWFAPEIDPVIYNDLVPGLTDSHELTLSFLHSIDKEKLLFRYAEGKWTIKEIWQHILDVERVLSYRALRWARNDKNILHGFDQNQWSVDSRANDREWPEIIDEYIAIRKSTISLFKSFSMDMIMSRGTAGKSNLTVRAVGYLILGHEVHHVKTIREKYV